MGITGSRFILKTLPDQVFIEDLALDLGVASAFIEKDWYATQLLSVIASYQSSHDVIIAFAGGTSLSKGYGIIERFSEDIDLFYDAQDITALTKPKRKAFRKAVIEGINLDERFEIVPELVEARNNSRFFKAPVTYYRQYEHGSLREGLQLEMSQATSQLPMVKKPIQSMISRAMKESPETEMYCISPLETAGNKLSALAWRVIARNRNDPNDDPAIIRHLHDLASLENMLNTDFESFSKVALDSLKRDKQSRGKGIAKTLSIKEMLDKAANILSTDKEYSQEYTKFVSEMTYADDVDQISFDNANAAFGRIISCVLST